MRRRAIRHAHCSARDRSCSSVNESAVIGDIVETVTAAAQKEVPWFLNEMPSAYFRQVPPALRQSHLRAITALSAQGILVPEVKLANARRMQTAAASPSSRTARLGRATSWWRGSWLRCLRLWG